MAVCFYRSSSAIEKEILEARMRTIMETMPIAMSLNVRDNKTK